MSKEIRHRRLYAFYNSKVLNSLMILIIACLLLMRYYDSILLPGICCVIGLSCFLGYSLWLWIKKPDSIIINKWRSETNGKFTLYFLIVMAIKNANQWWYIAPIILAVIIFFTTLVINRDEKFEIKN